MYVALIDRLLIAHVFIVERLLAENNLKHGDNATESEVVKTFLSRLVFIDDSDVTDAVDLVKSFNTVFHELSKFDCGVNGVGNTLDDDLFGSFGLEEIMSSLQIAANSDLVFNTDLVGRELFDSLVDSLVFVCHSGS